jgi:hypothetical protein
MKKTLFLMVLIPLFFSCNSDNKKGAEKSTRKEIMEAAVRYAREKFNEPKDTTSYDGIVTVQEGRTNLIVPDAYKVKYVIDPSKIVTGLIDDDENEDAIIYVASITGQDMENPENLILIKTDGKYMLNRVIESNMKVLGIADRIITAEVSSRSPNTPLRDCHVCKEVVKYKFKSGDLIRI